MSANYTNQKKLLKHLKKGKTPAYTYLVDLYYEQLCNYAQNLARDDYQSEDIVQNVIVRIWQQRDKLNSNINIKNYLYRSVYNEFIDQYRRSNAITALEKKYIEGLDIVLEDEDFNNSERIMAMVMKTVENLPPKCRETFLLSKKEGLTYIEIAEYQNVSVNTVEKQIGKAIRIVRETLTDKIKTVLFLLLGLNSKNVEP